jgi:peroxiredoxin (alkyl hydroperoxide reductase subunit C)
MSLVTKEAPKFKTDAVVDNQFKEVSLDDYRGRWVVLFFYPLDFTFVCPTEITAFSDNYEKFAEAGAEILGCSVDSKFSHLAWINSPRNEGGLGRIKYPLLADITKQIGRDYGVLLDAGITLRGLFIIDPEGNVAFEVIHDLGIGRNVDEVLRVLKAVQQTRETGEVCPANWTPGEDTMKGDPEGSREWFGTHAHA